MSSTKSIDRALSTLKILLASEGGLNVETLSDKLKIPRATVYRHISALERNGLIMREGPGSFMPGLFILQRFSRAEFNKILAERSRPIVFQLSAQLSLTAHLGVFEGSMVTYLVKSARHDDSVFTRETAQLDAYCSGLGKMLLSGMSQNEINSYLAEGRLPKITDATITDKRELRQELEKIMKQGYAIDSAEFEEGLYCLAVPILDVDGEIIAALSVSSRSRDLIENSRKRVLGVLHRLSDDISTAVYGSTGTESEL